MNVPTTGQSAQSASSQAITALVLGILSLLCCPFVGPIAWWLGNQERKAIREGRAPAAGDTLALVAVILGILGTIYLAFFVLWILFFGGMAFLSALGASAGSP
jgi:hypothetical protein